jgi:hypothetical protein
VIGTNSNDVSVLLVQLLQEQMLLFLGCNVCPPKARDVREPRSGIAGEGMERRKPIEGHRAGESSENEENVRDDGVPATDGNGYERCECE